MADKRRLPFRSIGDALDIDDAALDAVNARLGVPQMVRPVADTPRKLEPSTPAIEQARPAPEKLTVELPGYLMDTLRITAAERRTSIRHVIMLALKTGGFAIADADLVPDGRRTRRKSGTP